METERNVDTFDEAAPAGGALCCCFPFSNSSWQRIDAPAPGADDRSRWERVRVLAMKVREWSELVAGPRWKTFLRRFGRNPNRARAAPPPGTMRFAYDPLSYALNFDEGHGEDFDGDDGGPQAVGYRGFSARLATSPEKSPAGVVAGLDAPPPTPFVFGGH
ncbi:uncharacterized protein LOC121990864 [Zingiber officinale]|uniref:NHL repeat-containing protein n=1 Tax=Zingiber officinale TaxID=94328 RepID=A0A8J5FZX3_ZINOF|nr:uncharacterized protein LOC121990864 [Zingiber officinale]KAG6495344.1 hypothetical protein ZIOFF_043147 [Zingiber officinale]